jgi:flavin-dependent dehydrogenase
VPHFGCGPQAALYNYNWGCVQLDNYHKTPQEIAIVGASAAGLFTAYLLARGGRKVRVFEGRDQLDSTARTLIVTRCIRDVLADIGDVAVINEIRRFELFTDGRVATIDLRQPDLVLERAKLIPALADAARRAKAELFLGRRFLSLDHAGEHLSLTMEHGQGATTEEVKTQTVVGADGAHSRVAREAGWPEHSTAPLVQAIVPLPADLRPDTTRVWFTPEDTPYFYWLIPETARRGALGLIGQEAPSVLSRASGAGLGSASDSTGLHLLLERFLHRLHLTPLEFQAARIPVYTGWVPIRRRLAGGDVYLVGDAAGHVKVTTLGGVVTGFRGAKGVAEAILRGGTNPALSRLRSELGIHLLIRKLVHGFTPAHYSHLFDLLNASARKALEASTRDEPDDLLWRLCLQQPRILLLALRALLTGAASPSKRLPSCQATRGV